MPPSAFLPRIEGEVDDTLDFTSTSANRRYSIAPTIAIDLTRTFAA